MKPYSQLYMTIISYRLYRLNYGLHAFSSRETGKVKEFIKGMEIPIWKYHFKGDDPTRVLEFLARCSSEADIEEMMEF